MAFVPAICTRCGAQMEVDDTYDSGICKFCGTTFITEKAISNYVVNNVEERESIERLSYVTNIDIGGVFVPKEIGKHIIMLIESEQVVQAIKELREATGLGLKESKEAIDTYRGIHVNTTNSINNSSREASVKSNGACYIATYVYGSYDCPEVWTLRRFRDYTLDKTWYGRFFIKCYYAVSPTLVKWFGNKIWFRTFWKNKLDNMIYRLNNTGVKNTRYQDKY